MSESPSPRPLVVEISTTYNGGMPDSDGAEPRNYPLSRHTLFTGPTGSGKTTVLASIGLLLTGEADDSIGRAQVAAGTDLALAMAEEQDAIRIVGKFSDDTTATYDLARGKAAKKWHDADEWRHPVRKLRAILAQGPDNARRDMAPLLLGDDPVALWRILPRQLHELVPENVQVEGLSALVERAAEEERRLNKQRNTTEAGLAVTEAALPMRPSAAHIESLRRLSAAYEARATALAERAGARRVWESRKAQATAERDRLVTRAGELVAERQRLLAARSAEPAVQIDETYGIPDPVIPPEPTPPLTGEQRITLGAYVRVFSFAQPGKCPCCGQAADTSQQQQYIASKLAAASAFDVEWKAWFDAKEAALSAVIDQRERAATAAAAYAPQASDHRAEADIIRDYEQVSANHAAQTAKIEEATAEIGRIDAATAADTQPIGEDPRALYAAAQASEDVWTRVAAQRAELIQIQETAARASTLCVELARVMDLVYKERVEAAVTGVSRWLPKGWRMVLSLRAANGTRIFRLGMRKPNGRVVGNPSGGQRMALYLALAVWLAETERIPRSTGPMVVMPSEERTFTGQWLGDMMRALQESPVQLVICNIEKPKGRVAKTWQIVDLAVLFPESAAKAAGSDPQGSDAEGTPSDPPTDSPSDPLIDAIANAASGAGTPGEA